MSQTINFGKNFFILNIPVGESQTQILIPQSSNLTPFNGQLPTGCYIQNRSAAALQLTKNAGDTNYWTIPSGQNLPLNLAFQQDLAIPLFYLTAPSGQTTVEILFTYE